MSVGLTNYLRTLDVNMNSFRDLKHIAYGKWIDKVNVKYPTDKGFFECKDLFVFLRLLGVI